MILIYRVPSVVDCFVYIGTNFRYIYGMSGIGSGSGKMKAFVN